VAAMRLGVRAQPVDDHPEVLTPGRPAILGRQPVVDHDAKKAVRRRETAGVGVERLSLGPLVSPREAASMYPDQARRAAASSRGCIEVEAMARMLAIREVERRGRERLDKSRLVLEEEVADGNRSP